MQIGPQRISASNVLRFAAASAAGNRQLQAAPQKADVFAPRFGNTNADELAELKAEITRLRQEGDLSKLAARLVPATVSIVARGKANDPKMQSLVWRYPHLKELLKEQEIGSGSGFWIRCADGKPRIVTNAHVADIITEPLQVGNGLSVRMDARHHGILNKLKTALNFSRNEAPISVPLRIATARDGMPAIVEEYDIAVLEPDDDSFYDKKDGGFALPNGAEPLEFVDDINTVQPGQKVVKAGNSGGVGKGNLAVGYLDGFEARQKCECGDPRHDIEPEYMVAVTDLTIHPGDSGSALVTTDGKVIGVNSRTMTTGGEGLPGNSSAISAPVANQVLKSWGFLN